MGITKAELFTDRQNEIAQLAKVLGHPARIAILDFLRSTPTCITGDIVEHVGLAQPTISQHLRELRQAGLIRGTVEGSSVCYCLNPQGWETMQNLFTTFFNVSWPGDAACDTDCGC